jgi:hypothetical protein
LPKKIGISGQKITPHHNYLDLDDDEAGPNQKLLSKLLNANLSYFKYLKQPIKSPAEDELNVDCSLDSSSNTNSNHFFKQRPKTTNLANDQDKSIIYQLSKIHSNNRQKSFLFCNSLGGNRPYTSNTSYQKVEMNTLGLVDFKEENLVDIKN